MDLKKDLKRFDNIDNSQWMTIPFERTAEGFLKGRAIVTSIGVFTYKRKDGTIQRELRLPDEVFSIETLNSMKLKPVTLNHPTELVTSDNADKLQVGSLGDNPSRTKQETKWNGNPVPWTEITDGINCAIDMIITKKDAIDAVLNGKDNLSMGYTCDLEMAQPGATWCGVEYDFIQRNIRYNHCAIVDSARAGDNAKIELRADSEDAVLEDMVIKTDGGTKMLRKINLDGIECQADEEVLHALSKEKARADQAENDACESKKKVETADKKVADMEKKVTEMEKRVSELEAERDAAKEKKDAAEAELEKVKSDSTDPKRLDEAVKAKIELLHNAERAKVEVKEDMSDLDIKKAIITSQFPKANFDGKDDVYIQARYDSAVEMMVEKNDSNIRQVTSDLPPEVHADENDARNKMIQRMKNHGKEE